ncbi:MAG: DUF3604 domain-containing protein, partial [Rhodobacteraceae bacterium]|nr:DUF3604 domain-containing protein [Paracoccaceae bacterium]
MDPGAPVRRLGLRRRPGRRPRLGGQGLCRWHAHGRRPSRRPVRCDRAHLGRLGGEGPESGSLDRIQIVKGWTRDGQSFEKVYDVVWSGDREPEPGTGQVPPVPSTVDLTTATYTNEHGATELMKVWTDPDFDPGQHAFYYARVLEIPTPRWTTVQAVRLGVDIPDVVPA